MAVVLFDWLLNVNILKIGPIWLCLIQYLLCNKITNTTVFYLYIPANVTAFHYLIFKKQKQKQSTTTKMKNIMKIKSTGRTGVVFCHSQDNMQRALVCFLQDSEHSKREDAHENLTGTTRNYLLYSEEIETELRQALPRIRATRNPSSELTALWLSLPQWCSARKWKTLAINQHLPLDVQCEFYFQGT